MIDVAAIKSAARGRWREILLGCGVPAELLGRKSCPCPKCGGDDRYRFTDKNGDGAMRCSHCAPRTGDGIASLQWFHGWSFAEASDSVAKFLGLRNGHAAGGNGHAGNGRATKGKTPARAAGKVPPLKQLVAADDRRAAWLAQFAAAKPGCTVEQLSRCQVAAAMWPEAAPPSSRYQVLAFRCVDPVTWEPSGGMVIYQPNGAAFEAYKDTPASKTKVLGSDGLVIVGNQEEFRRAEVLIKCEGVPDAVALAAILPAGWLAVTNICGASSVDSWLPRLREAMRPEQRLLLAHDADEAGKKGAKIIAATG